MAGSRTWREYTSDTGLVFSIAIDESNANLFASLTGTRLAKIRTTNAPPLPIGIRPRVIHCWQQSNPTLKRSLIIGDPAIIKTAASLDGSLYFYNAGYTDVWITTGYRGESISYPRYYLQLDTGLNDGTISN